MDTLKVELVKELFHKLYLTIIFFLKGKEQVTRNVHLEQKLAWSLDSILYAAPFWVQLKKSI